MRIVLLFLLGAAALLPQGASFDYYLFALSWAPEFCATSHSGQTAIECDPRRHRGFVVHGLWPQLANGPSPENCGSGRPVARQIVNATLDAMPSAGLIQHEWRTHGTCSGLDPATYFSDIVAGYQVHPEAAVAGADGAARYRTGVRASQSCERHFVPCGMPRR